MNKKEKLIIYIIFMIVYILFSVYNYLLRSQWLFDALISMAFLTLVFFVAKWFKMQKPGFILFNLALLSHNLGSFDFYAKTWGIFGYDNFVHLFASLVAGYILFNFIARKLHIKKNKTCHETVVDEHKWVIIILVIAAVAMLGTFIELVEFGGFMFLGQGEGLFFTGSGDVTPDDLAGQYTDTMSDILVNTVGSIIGVLIFYYVQYKRKPWIRRYEE